jgi:formylglycine-generating enzyme required for sulfatase activity
MRCSRPLPELIRRLLVSALALPAAACELAVPLNHFDDGCPPGKQGPSGVRIEAASGTYCIDSTEVTNAQYQAFVAAATPGNVRLPMFCMGQTDFRPRNNTTGQVVQVPPGQENFPASQITWCDAYAYCTWAGKRLCGQIGGGAIAEGMYETNARLSQWYSACSKGGALMYPYGGTYNQPTCGGGGASAGSVPAPVGTRINCVGGYPGIYDMSGSLWEWADACDSNDLMASCHAYGGAFDSMAPADLSCAGVRYWGRTSTAMDIGFRCCTDL